MDNDQKDKQIKLLQKKLKRSEENRRQEQEIKDKNQILLNRLRSEIEQAKMTIEKRNDELRQLNSELEKEKEKSDRLLLNILPRRIAEDLKKTGTSTPECFENVTVYFSDLVGFTKISSLLDPIFLIEELNDIFSSFDSIIEANHCERIKTSGDAYIAVCGMGDQNIKHGENIVRSAVQIINYLQERNKKSRIEWKIRIGIHSGKLVGGIVGRKKYIYDIFGDTVNAASRMESSSKEMMINISESTYKLVKDKFELIERPLLGVKGKGEMKMWFVKPEVPAIPASG